MLLKILKSMLCKEINVFECDECGKRTRSADNPDCNCDYYFTELSQCERCNKWVYGDDLDSYGQCLDCQKEMKV